MRKKCFFYLYIVYISILLFLIYSFVSLEDYSLACLAEQLGELKISGIAAKFFFYLETYSNR